MTDEVLLRVDNLCKYFPVATNFFGKPIKFLKAVDGVSFSLKKGKTLGIVGESGCGKTTMGRTILRLYDVTKGDVYFKGQKVSPPEYADDFSGPVREPFPEADRRRNYRRGGETA